MGCCNARDEAQQTVAFGRSCVVGPLGETLAVCDDDEAEEAVVAELRTAAGLRKNSPPRPGCLPGAAPASPEPHGAPGCSMEAALSCWALQLA